MGNKESPESRKCLDVTYRLQIYLINSKIMHLKHQPVMTWILAVWLDK